MEARSFFENSPMREITVSGTPEEWNKILKRIPWDASEETQELIYMLNDLGVDYL